MLKLILFILILIFIIFLLINICNIYILSKILNKSDDFEEKFWSGMKLSNLYQDSLNKCDSLIGLEQIFYLGFKEFIYFHSNRNCSLKFKMNIMSRIMKISISKELELLKNKMNILNVIIMTNPYIIFFSIIYYVIYVLIDLDKINAISIHIITTYTIEILTITAFGVFIYGILTIVSNYYNLLINKMINKYNNFIEEFIIVLFRQIFINDSSI